MSEEEEKEPLREHQAELSKCHLHKVTPSFPGGGTSSVTPDN